MLSSNNLLHLSAEILKWVKICVFLKAMKLIIKDIYVHARKKKNE